MSLTLLPDTILADRYRLQRLVGEGGMGMVWAASHTLTRKPVALKFLKATNAEMTKRFLREARVAGTVNHPNVVPIHDVLQLDDGTPVMVMDLLQGESLAAKLERERALAFPELARILLPVVSAVGTAHALGIVHRDLKPDNIFLCDGVGGNPDVRVLDFGIAKLTATEGIAAETAGLTSTGAMLGTPYYMAPEQVFGERNIDHRADLWALGVILYEGLSGRKPIDGENLGQIFKAITLDEIVPLERLVPTLPVALTALVGRMLSRSRDARPGDLREVFAILSGYCDEAAQSFGAAVEPRPWTPSDPPPGHPSSRDARPAGETSGRPPPPRPLTPADGSIANPFDPTLGAPAHSSGHPGRTTASVVVPPRPSRRSAVGAAVLGLGLVALAGVWFARVTRTQVAPAQAAATATDQAGATAAAPQDTAEAAGASAPAALASSAPESASAARPAAATSARPARARAESPRPETKTEPAKPADTKLPGGIHAASPY